MYLLRSFVLGTGPRRAAAAVAVAGALAFVFWVPAVAKADGAPDKVGWWSEAQQSGGAIPVATATGTDLVVGNDVTGPNSVAAVHYSLPSTSDAATASGTLTLSVTPNSTVGTAAIVACPIAGDWSPVYGGAWSDKPTWSCKSSAPGTLSTDGATLAFPLTPQVESSPGVFSLAIVPSATAGPFQIRFSGPGAVSLVASPPVAGTPAAPSSPGPAPPSAISPAPGAPETAPPVAPADLAQLAASPPQVGAAAGPTVSTPESNVTPPAAPTDNAAPGPASATIAVHRAKSHAALVVALLVWAAVVAGSWLWSGDAGRGADMRQSADQASS